MLEHSSDRIITIYADIHVGQRKKRERPFAFCLKLEN